MICWVASGKSMTFWPPQLGSLHISTSLMLLLRLKMKVVIDSVLWPVENTVA